MEKVVKCKKCNLYFGHSEKNVKCPFCQTVYGEVEENPPAPAQGGQANGSASDGKDKKGTAKTTRKSFKIWKGN